MIDLWKNRDWTPMLLGEVSEPFNSKDYIFELKFDGTRTIIFANKETVEIYNRRKQNITYLYPELQNLKNLVTQNTIFDGEIISMENGKPSFNKLQKRAHLKNKTKILYQTQKNPVIFVCYDILYENKNLTELPILKRKEILNKYAENDYFIKTKYVENDGIKLYDAVKMFDLEGIVAKEKTSTYETSKRSNNWLKIKNLKIEEFFIGGFIEKETKFTISLILGEYKNNNFYYVGKVVLGKKSEKYKKLKKQNRLSKSPFLDYSNNDAIYVRPKNTCRVKYMERTKNNHLRQPFIF